MTAEGSYLLLLEDPKYFVNKINSVHPILSLYYMTKFYIICLDIVGYVRSNHILKTMTVRGIHKCQGVRRNLLEEGVGCYSAW